MRKVIGKLAAICVTIAIVVSLTYNGVVDRLFKLLEAQNYHTNVALDAQGRLLRSESYYIDRSGNHVLHGDIIIFDWLLLTRTNQMYRNGTLENFEIVSIDLNGHASSATLHEQQGAELSRP